MPRLYDLINQQDTAPRNRLADLLRQPDEQDMLSGMRTGQAALGGLLGYGERPSVMAGNDANVYDNAELAGILSNFVPSKAGIGGLLGAAGMIKNVGALKKGEYLPAEFAAQVKRGFGNLPPSATYDSAGNVFQDMTVSLKGMNNGDYMAVAMPPWGKKNKPFYMIGDDPEELAAESLAKLGRSDSALKAAEARSLLGMLKREYGDDAFHEARSTQSKSQYLTHGPSGTKIRISDHSLPLHYEGADLDLNIGMSDKDKFEEIKRFLSR